jgi:hypothetical protein
MSRRHRHYRKHRSVQTDVSSQQNETTQPTVVLPVDDTIAIVKHDLTRTLIISALLLAALIALSVLNSKQHWTLSLGSQLYTLLHIR